MNNYKYPFNTIYLQALDQFGAELDPDTYESIALGAWEKIGNKQTRLYMYSDEPEYLGDDKWKLDLPCNVEIIEAVTSDREDWEKTSNVNNHVNYSRSSTEQYIERNKRNTNSLYPSGGYIKFDKIGNSLYFTDKYNNVNVLYKGIVADEEGLPYLTETETEAIATYCAYSLEYKRALMTRDKMAYEFSNDLKQKWEKLCTQSRIPDYVTQNEMDEILNVNSSWDRKRFGKSFKPVR